MYKNRQVLVTNQEVNGTPAGTIIFIKNPGQSWSAKQQADYYSVYPSSMTDEEVLFFHEYKDQFYFNTNNNNITHISGVPLHANMAPSFDEFPTIYCNLVADSINPNWAELKPNFKTDVCQFLYEFMHGDPPPEGEEYSSRFPWINYRREWIKKCFWVATHPGINKVIWAYRYSFLGAAITAWKELTEDVRNIVRNDSNFNTRDKEILEKIWL